MTINGFFEGTEPGTELTQQPVGAAFFGFPANLITQLLTRTSILTGGALGVRLHFNAPRTQNQTELYMAACGFSKDIPDAAGNEDYFTSSSTPVSKEALPAFLQSKSSANTCVFFSRDLLRRQMSQPGVAMIRFYVVPFGAQTAGTVPNLSLVSVGIDSHGNTIGTFRRSEEPCPPHCPTDYP